MIYIDKKAVHLGMYDTPEDAAKAYNDAAVKYGVVKKDINRVKKSKETKVVAAKIEKKPKK
jgi:hypothetical protein